MPIPDQSHARYRRTLDNRQAEPTAAAPTTPTFISVPFHFISARAKALTVPEARNGKSRESYR
jgi:hypothetical protein